MKEHPMDISQLKSMVGDDDDVIRELLETFLSSGHETIDELESAINSGVVENVKLKAHSLKGASANYGADTLHRVCSHMEDAATNNDLSEIPRMFLDLKRKFTDVEGFIGGWIASHS